VSIWQESHDTRHPCHSSAWRAERTIDPMTTTVILLVLAVALAVLAPRFGTDTRDGRDWRAC